MPDRAAPAPLRGMILAAGYGTRLAPVTDHVPKPLITVDGVALLDHAVQACTRAGADLIGVNTHHLGARVAEHVQARGDAARFTLFPEPEILGTGGALHGARGFLRGAPRFLLHNGDVLCDGDLAGLLAGHLDGGAQATLLLADWPAVNSVDVAADGSVLRLAGRPADAEGVAARALTYTGIGVFEASVLDRVPPGFSSLVDLLAGLLQDDPASVRGWSPDGLRWSDVGTLGRWLAAQRDDAAACELLTPITGQGSDRRFWRVRAGGWSAVAMLSPRGDAAAEEDFTRFVATSRFLTGAGLRAAAPLAVDEQDHAVLLEDLGAATVLQRVSDPRTGADERHAIYDAAIDWLAALQGAESGAAAACPEAVDRRLDRDVLRWESDYFALRCLCGLFGFDQDAVNAMLPEFNALADVVDAQPQVLIHRDYQSQNLVWQDGRLGVVDHQGMRRGPLGYDAASLLWDPYVPLDDGLRDALVLRLALQLGRDPDEVAAMTLAAAVQRLMQALGAYGFLSRVKGKPQFLAHVPRGLDHLRQVLVRAEALRAGAAPSPWLPPPLPLVAAAVDRARAAVAQGALDDPAALD